MHLTDLPAKRESSCSGIRTSIRMVNDYDSPHALNRLSVFL